MEEELLEPVARYVRFTEGIKYIDKTTGITLVDIGCGPRMRFKKFVETRRTAVATYIGIDPLIKPEEMSHKSDSVILLKESLDQNLSVQSNSIDRVVGFAVLEHVDHPQKIVEEAFRILKPGGKAIFTTPSWKAKGILEFLSFTLHIISPREIEEHKTYFNKKQLLALTQNLPPNCKMLHKYFEFGLNNLFVIEKI